MFKNISKKTLLFFKKNHIIGLPSKDTVEKPLYDYEQIIFDSLVTQNSNKHHWIKKAAGLGI
jgi:hypothetical protein